MPVGEEIHEGDAIYRSVDVPRMYSDVDGLIWKQIFEFSGSNGESVIWGKYAPTLPDVHNIGCQRAAIKRDKRPEFDYAGCVSSTAGLIRNISVSGHRFKVLHVPEEGLHHAEIHYDIFEGAVLTKPQKLDLKFQLQRSFGPLHAHSCP